MNLNTSATLPSEIPTSPRVSSPPTVTINDLQMTCPQSARTAAFQRIPLPERPSMETPRKDLLRQASTIPQASILLDTVRHQTEEATCSAGGSTARADNVLPKRLSGVMRIHKLPHIHGYLAVEASAECQRSWLRPAQPAPVAS